MIDFALCAKMDGSISKEISNMHYMAPELFTVKKYTQAIDMWSIGIIMYNLLKQGAHPFFSKVISKSQIVHFMKNDSFYLENTHKIKIKA